MQCSPVQHSAVQCMPCAFAQRRSPQPTARDPASGSDECVAVDEAASRSTRWLRVIAIDAITRSRPTRWLPSGLLATRWHRVNRD